MVLTNPRHYEISVLGNVKKEGNFQMLKPTDVMQALSMAGGFNEWADKDEVFISARHRPASATFSL